jgi:hypothetical protein
MNPRSPALAIGWEMARRHRWGFGALAAYVIALAMAGALRTTITTTEDDGVFALTLVVPLTWALFYLLAVFCFGITGDLSRRESIYPARMFTLPVSTAALSTVPMMLGTVVVMSLWLAVGMFVRWPSWIDVPFLWPAFFAAAFLAWTQALMWMPYGLPGFRPFIAVALLITGDAIVILAIELKVPESTMVAVMATLVPLAYLTGYQALTLARRGGVADWRERFGSGAGTRSRSRGRHFASPAAAQLWLEWRQRGRSLPVLVAIVLPFELGLLFMRGMDASPRTVYYALLAVLLTPRLMAAYVAVSFRSANPHEGDPHAMPHFMAARPMSSSGLVGAQLGAAALSTLVTWALVLLAIPLALDRSGTWWIVRDALAALAEVIGTPRVIAVSVLAVLALAASTWKQLVQGLCIGLTGREWLVRVNTLVILVLTIAVVPTVDYLRRHRDVLGEVFDALPWIVAALVAVKMLAAAWVAVRLHAVRPLTDRALVTGAAVWLAAVFTLYGVFVWLMAPPPFPRYILLLIAILFVPLARVSAAPLALAWNRHR